MYTHAWVSNFILVHMSVFLPVSYCFNYSVYILRFEIVILPALFFSLGIFCLFCFVLWVHVNFRIVFSISVMNGIGIDWIGLNLQKPFGKIITFTILILPIHEHGMPFHFLVLDPSPQKFKFFSIEVLHLLCGLDPCYFLSMRLLRPWVCP